MVKIWGLWNDGRTMDLGEPESLSITDAFDSPATGMETRLPWNGYSPEFARVQVVRDGSTLFEGGIDEQRLETTGQGESLVIQARGPGAGAIDNEARPQTYFRVTLRDIFQRHLAPYGLTLESPYNPRLLHFAVHKGVTEWEVLELFCARAGLPRPVVWGSQVLVRPWQAPKTWRLGGGYLPLVRLEVICRRCAVLSHVLWRTGRNDYLSCVTNDRFPYLGVLRKRYVIPPSDEDYDPRADAAARVREGNLQYRSVRAVLPGWQDANLLDRAWIDDYRAGGREYVVCQVARQMDGNGGETTLTLADPTYLL